MTIYTDADTALVPILPSAAEVEASVDSNTAVISISGTAPFEGKSWSDSGTAILVISPVGVEEQYGALFQDISIEPAATDKILLTFTKNITADTYDASKFTATANGSAVGVTSVVSPGSGTAKQVEVTLARAIAYNEQVKVTYAP